MDRFNNSDVRFAPIPKKQKKILIDKRFHHMLDDPKFKSPSSVDKYGRKIKTRDVDFKKIYVSQDNDEKKDPKIETKGKKRGANLDAGKKGKKTQTSQKTKNATKTEKEVKSQPVEKLQAKREKKKKQHSKPSSEAQKIAEIEEKQEEQTKEEKDSDSDSDSDSDDEISEEEIEEIPKGEVTRRFAIQNMEWERIRAVDLLFLLRSYLPSIALQQKLNQMGVTEEKKKLYEVKLKKDPTLYEDWEKKEQVISVTVYPSQYGLEKMKEESIYGPLSLFQRPEKVKDAVEKSVRKLKLGKKSEKNPEQASGVQSNESGDEEDDEDSDSFEGFDDENNTNEIDMEKLRKYELDKLKYYYAVVECDTKETAAALYKELDGKEFETSSNAFDLRFIPDDVTFDDQAPRDIAKEIPKGEYQGPTFVTKALQQSRVELTWDRGDPNRISALNKAFKADEDEELDDLNAYLGSDSDEDGDDDNSKKSSKINKGYENKSRRKLLRNQLFAEDQDETHQKEKDSDEDDGEVEITFEPGLKEVAQKIVENTIKGQREKEDTVWEAQLRKQKEKQKAKNKERRRTKRGKENEVDSESAGSSSVQEKQEDQTWIREQDDDFFTYMEDENVDVGGSTGKGKQKQDQKQGKKANKKEKSKKDKSNGTASAAELALLLERDGEDKEYSLRDLVKQNKLRKKEAKRRKQSQNETLSNQDPLPSFQINLKDPRFTPLLTNPKYLLDPTDPRYKATAGTEDLLQQQQSVRQKQRLEQEQEIRQRKEQLKRKADYAPLVHAGAHVKRSKSSKV